MALASCTRTQLSFFFPSVWLARSFVRSVVGSLKLANVTTANFRQVNADFFPLLLLVLLLFFLLLLLLLTARAARAANLFSLRFFAHFTWQLLFWQFSSKDELQILPTSLAVLLYKEANAC